MDRKLSKAHNKKTGITYVYEVLENHWDPELKQARNTRRLIGKIDPVTNEIVPTGRKGPHKTSESEELEHVKEEYRTKFQDAQKNVSDLQTENAALLYAIQKFAKKHQMHLNAINKSLQDEESALKELLDAVGKLSSPNGDSK